jgi:hypothetical protein
MIRHRHLTTALGMLALGTIALAAPPPQAAGATVTIDLLVTGADGRPAPALAPEDIALKIGGRERPVRSIDLVRIGGVPNEPAAPPAATLPSPFGETRREPGSLPRTVLLLVDEGTLFGLDEVFRNAVAELLAAVGPRDRVGLASTRPGGVNVAPTTRHDAVREAAKAAVLGRGTTTLCIGPLLAQVHGLAQALPAGRATTLALISRGGASGNPAERGGFGMGGANCGFRREDLRPVEAQVAAAQINYVVFHTGAGGPSQNLENFAGATGAESRSLTFADAGGLARAVSGTSQFFRVTIDADAAAARDLLRVEVRANRPGLTVKGPAQVSLRPVPGRRVDAASLLRGTAAGGDLPVRVAAYASRHDGPLPAKLVVVIEPVDRAARLTEAMVALVGADGEVAGQWTARRGDLERTPVVAAVPVAAGTYRVRAAAVDEGGRGGTAEYDVTAAAGGGGVALSGMILGVSGAGGFSPRLLFGAEPAATAYFEIYGVPPSALVSATFELASSSEGPPIASVPGILSAGSMGRMVTASLPLDAVSPGDTLVRARVTIDGARAGEVVRTLRKAGGTR